ncbi:MAG: hypothetical protein KAV45_01920 [Calditrichia bacterium]|nr:hypothetical protein [Calditrichia bacterium]
MNKSSKIFVVVVLFLAPVALVAQNNLENNVKIILSDPTKGEEYLKGYTQPLVTSFGIIMGGALFHRADVKLFPHLDVGLSFVSIKMPDKSKTFNWKGERVPTFFGTDNPPEGAVHGTNFSKFMIPQLQLNLELFADFELMFRGNPSYEIVEIGEIAIYGIGVKYGLSDLISIPDFDLALSAQASYHVLRVSNWLNTGTFGMNVQVSKNLPFIPMGVYTGVGYEATSMTMSTDEIAGIGDNAVGDVKLNGENGLRILFGLSLNVYFLTVNIDYNISEYNSIGGGAKLVF